MGMASAAAAPDLRGPYLDQTKAFFSSKDIGARSFAALDRARGLERGWARASVAARNLVLRDALLLLSPPKTTLDAPVDNWTFVEVDELSETMERLLKSQSAKPQCADSASAALELIKRLVLRAKEDTYPSFDALVAAQRTFVAVQPGAGPDDAAMLRYEGWLKRYRPYLVLGVPLADENRVEEAETLIQERLKFFLSKSPENSSVQHYTDRLWTYVYDVRHSLLRAAEHVHQGGSG